MKRIFTTLFSVLILVICASNSVAGPKAKPVFDARKWVLGWSKNDNGSIFEEYVLEGEKVESWSELVTVQYYPGLQKKITLAAWEATAKQKLTGTCPMIKWESLFQSADERLWKWTISECPGQPSQSEICRVKSDAAGFHIWHYAIKKSPMPPEVEKTWLSNLKGFQISDDAQSAAVETDDEDDEEAEKDADAVLDDDDSSDDL